MNNQLSAANNESRLDRLVELKTFIAGESWRQTMQSIADQFGVEVIDIDKVRKVRNANFGARMGLVVKLEKLADLVAQGKSLRKRSLKQERDGLLEEFNFPVNATVKYIESQKRRLERKLGDLTTWSKVNDQIGEHPVIEEALQLGLNGLLTDEYLDMYIRSERQQQEKVTITKRSVWFKTPNTVLADDLKMALDAGRRDEEIQALADTLHKRLTGRNRPKGRFEDWDLGTLDTYIMYHELILRALPERGGIKDALEAMKHVKDSSVSDSNQKPKPRQRGKDWKQIATRDLLKMFYDLEEKATGDECLERKLHAMVCELNSYSRRIDADFTEMTVEELEQTIEIMQIVKHHVSESVNGALYAATKTYERLYNPQICWLDEQQDEDMSRSDRKRRDQLAHKKKKSAEAFVRGNENGRVERPGLK